MSKIVEICCGSYEDALTAFHQGADRIELNSALFLGGLTPSMATLQKAKANIKIPIIAMVRPRGAGFCYSEEEFEVMLLDCKLLLEHGADGIAFGCLNEDKTIDMKRNKQIVDIIHSCQKEAVFHRAFDCVEDYHTSIRQLIELKVDRVLTSGTKATTYEGMHILKELQSIYGKQIEILAGCGIKANNVKEIISVSGISQVHASCRSWKEDSTTINGNVSYAYAEEPVYEIVDESISKAFCELIHCD